MKEVAQRPKIPYEREKQKLVSFFALKFHDGDKDKNKVETIEKALNKAGIQLVVMARDVEKWGNADIPDGKKMMTDYAFPSMSQCDCNTIEFTEKGVGLGMNAGFCYAEGKPIYVIAKTGSDISTTMANVDTEVIFYEDPEDLVEPFTRIAKKFPRVILASRSAVRRQQMIDASIQFEVIVSDADETPDTTKGFKDQLAEIARRKAITVFEATKDRGKRLIISADQNLVFDGKMYGKPKSYDDARNLLCKMRGSEEIYAYTGNSILLCDGDRILQSINITDVARLSMDYLTDEEVDKYLEDDKYLSFCGGVNINYCLFLHLKEGRLSTAKGMTLEYAKELLPL